MWLVSQNRRRSDIEPKPRPGPKTYRKPGSAADNEPNPTHPTSTDISDVSDFGGATNAARESDTIRHIPLGMSDVGSASNAIPTLEKRFEHLPTQGCSTPPLYPPGRWKRPNAPLVGALALHHPKRPPGKQVRRASQKQGKARLHAVSTASLWWNGGTVNEPGNQASLKPSHTPKKGFTRPSLTFTQHVHTLPPYPPVCVNTHTP